MDNSSSRTTTSATTTATAALLFAASCCCYVAVAIQRKKSKSSTPPPVSPTLSTLSTKADILALRHKHCSSALSISYANSNPLWIVRGHQARLQDETGIWYLDTRNNVAHVGHGNAAVTKAVQDQVGVLNTNTRYLHPYMVQLAQRIADLLPDPLQVVWFCNSGSEANDLALRLARAWNKHQSSDTVNDNDNNNDNNKKNRNYDNTIVVEGAYHGHTLANLEISPYKYQKGTEFTLLECQSSSSSSDDHEQLRRRRVPGRHIYPVPAPDVYRGPYRDVTTAGAQYAAYVERACDYFTRECGASSSVRAFIVEGGMSVAGVILPPPGYLTACREAVHAAGGLYIADEVQTGFGRLGTTMFAFQYHDPDLVPDIVTLGKPLGNGMPLAAVVTTRDVAACLEATGVEYFNTFAGNPVCAAAGLAVLNELERLDLPQHATMVGNHLMQKFRALMDTIAWIGDVRGAGLFIGVELVKDRTTQTPATEETSFICSILKSKYHILTSIDGPGDNVLVIKPPMVFTKDDADYFIECFTRAATVDLPAVDLSQWGRTPT